MDMLSLIISGFALIVSLFGLYHNRIEAINAYFENDRSEALLKAREIVHSLKQGYDPVELMKNHGNEIAGLIIFYNQAAVLIEKHQLPFWVFSKQISSGFAIISLWENLKPYIDMRRIGKETLADDIYIYPNPSLAKPFQKLYDRVKKSYDKAL